MRARACTPIPQGGGWGGRTEVRRSSVNIVANTISVILSPAHPHTHTMKGAQKLTYLRKHSVTGIKYLAGLPQMRDLGTSKSPSAPQGTISLRGRRQVCLVPEHTRHQDQVLPNDGTEAQDEALGAGPQQDPIESPNSPV